MLKKENFENLSEIKKSVEKILNLDFRQNLIRLATTCDNVFYLLSFFRDHSAFVGFRGCNSGQFGVGRRA